MSIQRCPNEVLDMVFHFLPFQSPDKAPAVVLSTMRTCSRFRAIAERHLIRVVCLQNAKRVNLFAAYLTQLINTGAYGKARLPIEHMAVFGKYQIALFGFPRERSEPEKAAEYILPFIISTAAPTLHSLVIFGFDAQRMPEQVNDEDFRNIVQPSVRFPKLQKLILLEQRTISLYRKPEENSLQYCYPKLTALYTHSGPINGDIIALHTLRRLRLDMLDPYCTDACPSCPSGSHIETIIIDATPYTELFARTYIRYKERYIQRVKYYQALVNSASNSLEGCVVVGRSPKNRRVHAGPVLRAWKDIVQGRLGCWEKEWKPIA